MFCKPLAFVALIEASPELHEVHGLCLAISMHGLMLYRPSFRVNELYVQVQKDVASVLQNLPEPSQRSTLTSATYRKVHDICMHCAP